MVHHSRWKEPKLTILISCHDWHKAGSFKRCNFIFLLYQRVYPKYTTTGRNISEGGRPVLVVMGVDSCSKGHGFESQHRILDGHFSHIFVVKIVNDVCWKWPKINDKRGLAHFIQKDCLIFSLLLSWNVFVQLLLWMDPATFLQTTFARIGIE